MIGEWIEKTSVDYASHHVALTRIGSGAGEEEQMKTRSVAFLRAGVRVSGFCCRQQKSYFVAIPVMWRWDTALPQALIQPFISALTYFRADESVYLASQRHSPGCRFIRHVEADR